jgi:DNA-directed RNA polymerase I subunit RPA2
MYSGITGEEFSADIYLGVVYYQRLRHMVNDKFQVRTTGPVDPLTRQPVKGRKRAGGIRFGEMERDALIAHGTSFLLQDRLMNCSDYSTAWVCRKCGSLVSLGFEELRGETEGREYCRVCDREDVREVKVESGNADAGDAGRRKPSGEIVERHGIGIAARRGQGMDVIAVPCEWSRDARHRMRADIFRRVQVPLRGDGLHGHQAERDGDVRDGVWAQRWDGRGVVVDPGIRLWHSSIAYHL